MYLKDKSHRITLRLNDEQMNFVLNDSKFLGVSPSDYLRMIINACMSSTKLVTDKIKEGSSRENDKTNIDNKL